MHPAGTAPFIPNGPRAPAGWPGLRATAGPTRYWIYQHLGNLSPAELDQAEWEWVTESLAGDRDHVVLATSLPLLLPRGIHGVEAWTEAVCDGAWGRRFARTGERVRQALDLEHWAAFGRSFENFERLLSGLGAGEYGTPPASVTVVSGDVHNRLAGVRKPGIRWRDSRGPWFDNMLATLEFDGRGARIRFDRATRDAHGSGQLEPVCETDLASP
jgi:hypothetical protein